MTKEENFAILAEVMRNKSIITTIITLVIAFFLAAYVQPSFFNDKVERLDELTPFSIERRVKEVDFELGLDLQGGAHLVYLADLTGVEEREVNERMRALRDLIERRVDHFGIGEPLVQVRGDRLIVELPGVRDQEEAIEQIGETPFLEFKIARPEEELMKIEEKRTEVESFLSKGIDEITDEDKELLEENVENWELSLEDQFISVGLTGRFLRGATVNFNQVTGQPLVSLDFDREGGEILHQITKDNVGRSIATYLDDEIIQVATIQEEISGGQAQISGNLDVQEARDLARNLQIGALPVPIELLSQRSIGPALGQRSLSQSVQAGILGFLAVIVFICFYYKMLGVLASISLIVYMIFVLSVFKLLPVTMTLSGIAGFVLSIGMAIDANILIFARFREEMKEGKNFKKAFESGFSRAWPSIRDGNLTTLIVAMILFFVSTSFVQGFATVLIIGIVISVFVAMVVTRSLMGSFLGGKLAEIKKLWL